MPLVRTGSCCERYFSTPVSQGFVHLLLHRKKSFLFSALYAAFIFGGRHLMNKRAKFELRKPLVLWSLTLAVFRVQWCAEKFLLLPSPHHGDLKSIRNGTDGVLR
uniref:very-long-chain 3-oxoacyl-CoA synthase n=1 Tax=Mus spicilegus TaxID=10103 RepID=A0A8C6IHU8_MUSSI